MDCWYSLKSRWQPWRSPFHLTRARAGPNALPPDLGLVGCPKHHLLHALVDHAYSVFPEKKKSQRKFLPSRLYEYIRHLWKIARITPVFFLFSVQCFRKGPQLQTWSACRPMCWNGRHLGRISLERPYFPMLMPDYIIEGNTQAAAQGNSWQDGVNALVML